MPSQSIGFWFIPTGVHHPAQIPQRETLSLRFRFRIVFTAFERRFAAFPLRTRPCDAQRVPAISVCVRRLLHKTRGMPGMRFALRMCRCNGLPRVDAALRCRGRRPRSWCTWIELRSVELSMLRRSWVSSMPGIGQCSATPFGQIAGRYDRCRPDAGRDCRRGCC